MIAGGAFITPHAVAQFKARIPGYQGARYEDVLAVIIKALREDVRSVKPTRNGKGLCLRVRGRVNFRAVMVAGTPQPSIVTILRSGK